MKVYTIEYTDMFLSDITKKKIYSIMYYIAID